MCYLKILVYFVLFFINPSCSSDMQSTTNFPIATAKPRKNEHTTKSRYDTGLQYYDEIENNYRKSRGMDHHTDYHDHDMPEQKAVKEDNWTGYYDFLINEGSFKFWAAFQLITAVLLIYSAFAAVYYAKFNVITADYDYDYDFFGRSNNDAATSNWSGLSSSTFQRIFDALSSKKYS